MTRLYHGTSSKNADLIKKNGLSLEFSGTNWGTTYGKAIYFTPNYSEAKLYAQNFNEDGIVLTFDFNNLKTLQLSRDYSPSDKKDKKQISSLINYLKLTSEINCLINVHKNEYILFKL